MTEPQAEFISDNFEILSNATSDGPLLSSGFDATVWRGRAGTDYAGSVYLSLRGTSSLADLLDDIDLALSGAARAQYVDMINWWLRETTPANQNAKQIKLTSGGDGLYFFTAPSATGTGVLNGLGHVELTGHSLGGHLATAFARLFGGQISVDHVTTFNSAGFRAASDSIFREIESLIASGSGNYPDSGQQSNFFGMSGLNFVANSFFFGQIGHRVELFNEDGFSNHSMYKLTDSLAVMAAMSKLDSTVTIGRANEILKAGANLMPASLEGVVDGLRRLFVSPAASALSIGDASDSAASRVEFHNAIRELQENSFFKLLSGSADLGLVGSNLGSQAKARVGFEEIAALISLNPMIVSARTIEGRSALESLWQSDEWNTRYQQWLADKASIQSDTEAENFTEQYLEDRSLLLQAIVARNTKDITNALVRLPNAPSDQNLLFRYAEPGTGNVTTLAVWNSATGSDTRPEQFIYFDDDASHQLAGKEEAKFGDHLYGA
ncbi:MAG: hypothetical protein ACMG55_14015, partial [Microcoleus sp.]